MSKPAAVLSQVRGLWSLRFLGSVLLTTIAVISCKGPAGISGDDAQLADSLPPVIEWITPDAGTVVTSTVLLSAQARDDQQIYRVAFFVAGFEFAGTLTDSAQGIYDFNWDASRYPEGPYPLVAMVWDNSRQIGSTPQRIVIVRR